MPESTTGKPVIKRLVSAEEEKPFCRLHDLARVLLLEGRVNGYPQRIDFDALLRCMLACKAHLEDVIFRRKQSYFREEALEAYTEYMTSSSLTALKTLW